MEQGPVPLTGIPKVDVKASAGPGALADEFVAERARWFLPEGMIRYDGGAVPGAIRALRVRGESMESELSEGDRLQVDTARRVPETGEMFVLWDGNGLVVKRVEHVRADARADTPARKSAGGDFQRAGARVAPRRYSPNSRMPDNVTGSAAIESRAVPASAPVPRRLSRRRAC